MLSINGCGYKGPPYYPEDKKIEDKITDDKKKQ